MANRTSSGLLLPLIVVVGLVAVFGGGKVLDAVESIFSGGDPVILGAGESAIMVAGDAESDLDDCTVEQVLNDRSCGDLKVLVMNAERMPFIGRNIQLAWSEGQPYVLHRNSAKQASNRAAACGSFQAKYPGGSCDEYAFATTDEGGGDARVEEVPLREQRCQGGSVNAGYAKANIQQGEAFLVVISHPEAIATEPFTGKNIAEDTSSCTN